MRSPSECKSIRRERNLKLAVLELAPVFPELLKTVNRCADETNRKARLGHLPSDVRDLRASPVVVLRSRQVEGTLDVEHVAPRQTPNAVLLAPGGLNLQKAG